MRFHSPALVMGAIAAGLMDIASNPLVEEPIRKRGKGQNNRRGKGLQAKPRKRLNLKTVSKRVRRKHRRQA